MEFVQGLTVADVWYLEELEEVCFEIDEDFSEEELKLIDERMEEALANPDAGIPVDEAIAEIRKMIKF